MIYYRLKPNEKKDNILLFFFSNVTIALSIVTINDEFKALHLGSKIFAHPNKVNDNETIIVNNKILAMFFIENPPVHKVCNFSIHHNKKIVKF